MNLYKTDIELLGGYLHQCGDTPEDAEIRLRETANLAVSTGPNHILFEAGQEILKRERIVMTYVEPVK